MLFARPPMTMTAEQEAVLRSIRKLVDFWGITSDELADVPASSPPVEPSEPPPLTAKYRHPVSGETWDGIGSQPPWLRDALIRQGYTVEELRASA